MPTFVFFFCLFWLGTFASWGGLQLKPKPGFQVFPSCVAPRFVRPQLANNAIDIKSLTPCRGDLFTDQKMLSVHIFRNILQPNIVVELWTKKCVADFSLSLSIGFSAWISTFLHPSRLFSPSSFVHRPCKTANWASRHDTSKAFSRGRLSVGMIQGVKSKTSMFWYERYPNDIIQNGFGMALI